MDLISSFEKDFVLYFVLFFLVGRIGAEDDYGTWHRTLTPLQNHACDYDELVLQCSDNTIISVHYVSYGSQKNSDHLCPGSTAPHPGVCQSSKAVEVIRDRCHKQRICRLQASPETFREDPCPGVRKYIEVMYKCRPEQFLNKIVCEGGQLHLRCPPGQGLTIYSASFGTTKSGAVECRQPTGVEIQDCLINHADETVRSLCSGKQNCSLRADDRTFGNPDCVGTKYLKVAYNCVELKYLLPTTRPSEENIQTTSYPAWAVRVDQSVPNVRSREYGRNEISRPSDTSKPEMQSDEVPISKKETLSGNQELVGFMSKWVSAQKYMTGNKDKLILYISLSLGLGIVACVTVLSARCVIHRLESRRSSSSKFHITPETEDQFFSDSDLEQYDPPESLPLPIINYTASMKRHGSEVLPRAPIDNSIEHNHYFS